MYDRLDAFVLAMSQHYRILREVIGRSHGPVPYPSVQDARAADMVASMMENIGGCGLANFCRLRFRKAYLSGDCRIYDVRKVLEIIMASSKNDEFKALLKSRMDSLLELVDRLSTPISSQTKKRRSNERKSGKLVQMMLFPEMEEKSTGPVEAESGSGADCADGAEKEKKKKSVKQRKPRKARTPTKRKTKLDKLADEIINSEYGTEEDDELEEERQREDDTCDYYDRGYSRMRGSDYDYFSGGYYND